MKQLFTLALLSLALLSCKKESADPPTPKTLSQTEMDLMGTWNHDSTVHDPQSGSQFTAMPVCSGACLVFTETENTTPGVDHWDYDLSYNMSCTNIPSGWAVRNDTVYVANLNYKLLQLDANHLVLQQGNVTAVLYFSR